MRITNKLIIEFTVSSIIGRVLDNIKIKDNVSPNTETTFNNYKDNPAIDASSYIHHYVAIIGSVDKRKNVFIGPFSSNRADDGLKIFIGNESIVQDGVVLHGIENYEYQSLTANNSIFKDNIAYSIYIGNKVSLAPQCQVHGPTCIDTNVYVGMQSLVFDSYIKESVVLEPGSKVVGVIIPQNRYALARKIITNQEEVELLPEISPQFQYYDFNKKVVSINFYLTKGYKRLKK